LLWDPEKRGRNGKKVFLTGKVGTKPLNLVRQRGQQKILQNETEEKTGKK